MKVLIDTWWNVNQSYGEEQLKEAFVLIDTWWNVNVTCGKNSPLMETVLIDTWWNVNSKANGSFTVAVRFNRYMVECESFQVTYSTKSMSSFNRYMVECEYPTFFLFQSWSSVLIDTWWNVNSCHYYDDFEIILF